MFVLKRNFGVALTLLLGCCFYFCSECFAATTGDPPVFDSGIRLQDNSGYMQPGLMYSAPCVTDWNADGKKDLLVGGFFYGNIFLYLNSGTNEAPVFTTSSKLQANGVDISVPYD